MGFPFFFSAEVAAFEGGTLDLLGWILVLDSSSDAWRYVAKLLGPNNGLNKQGVMTIR